MDRTAKRNFPVKMDMEIQSVFHEKIGMYTQYIVAANGIVIAHFVDERSAQTYLNEYIKRFGFASFLKKITEAMETQYRNGVIKREL